MSRSLAAIRTVSKIMLRYANLWITQSYLGKVCYREALRGCENLCRPPRMYDLLFLGLLVSEDLVKLLISPLMDTVF